MKGPKSQNLCRPKMKEKRERYPPELFERFKESLASRPAVEMRAAAWLGPQWTGQLRGRGRRRGGKAHRSGGCL